MVGHRRQTPLEQEPCFHCRLLLRGLSRLRQSALKLILISFYLLSSPIFLKIESFRANERRNSSSLLRIPLHHTTSLLFSQSHNNLSITSSSFPVISHTLTHPGGGQKTPIRLALFLCQNHPTKSDVTSGWKLSWTLVSLETKHGGSTPNIFFYILNWQLQKLYTMTV